MDQQDCIRALLVAGEHCSGIDDEYVEVDDRTFATVPKDLREEIDRRADSPIDAAEFEDLVEQWPELLEWLASQCSTAGIDADDTDAMRRCVRGKSEQFMSERIDGKVTDRTVDAVARAV